MKQLNDLFLEDRFRFTPQVAEELVKESKLRAGQRGNVFMVTMKYDRARIRIGDTTTGKGRTTLEKRMTMEKIEVSGDLEVIRELDLDSVRNLVKCVEISFYSTDLEKSLMGFFYLKQRENKLELTPKLPTTSLNWNGYVQADGFPIPMLHLTRIAGVWVDLLMNIDRRIKAVEFLVPDMGQVSVTFNFRHG